MLVPASINAMLIPLFLCGFLISTTFLQWLVSNLDIFYVSLSGVHIYQLPLAFNRFVAIYWPLSYPYKFTERRIIIASFIVFFIPYAPFILRLTVVEMSLKSSVVIMTRLTVVVAFLNLLLHLATVLKLKVHFRSTIFANLPTTDPKFVEMKQVIKSNLLQSFVPHLCQAPFLFVLSAGTIIFRIRNTNYVSETILVNVWDLSLMFSMVFLLPTPLITPLCIVCVIEAYKRALKVVVPTTKIKRCFLMILFLLPGICFTIYYWN